VQKSHQHATPAHGLDRLCKPPVAGIRQEPRLHSEDEIGNHVQGQPIGDSSQIKGPTPLPTIITTYESMHAGDEYVVSAFYICNGESEGVVVDEFRWSKVLYLMARSLGSTNAKEVPNHRELPLGLVLVLVKIKRRVSELNVRLGNRALYSYSRTGSNSMRIVLVSCTGVRWKDGMPAPCLRETNQVVLLSQDQSTEVR
jgi:hypothetical protein